MPTSTDMPKALPTEGYLISQHFYKTQWRTIADLPPAGELARCIACNRLVLLQEICTTEQAKARCNYMSPSIHILP